MKRARVSVTAETVVVIGCLLALGVVVFLAVRAPAGGWVSVDAGRTNATGADSPSVERTTRGGTGRDAPSATDAPPVQIRIRSPEAAPALTNDAAGPLFVETNMTPGTTATRCVSVTNVGVQVADVRFFATVDDAGLARHVAFVIESGRGLPDDDCSRLAGTEVFRGTLARLAARHRDFATGIASPERIYPNESLSYRLTQRLEDSSPQGLSARARFGWEARGAGAPSPLRGRDLMPFRSNETTPTTRVEREESSIVDVVIGGAREVAERGWSWFVLLVLVAAFLVIQDRIDRRDPRLAGARVHPEPDQPFSGRLGRSTHTSEA